MGDSVHLTKTHYSCDLKLFGDFSFVGDRVVRQRPKTNVTLSFIVFGECNNRVLEWITISCIWDFEDNNICRSWLSMLPTAAEAHTKREESRLIKKCLGCCL